ncbi:MAG: GNAT family N-acetyltransferase [Halobacteria archaeon]|nr:GNAT family N-acetyltransferase [Halobacteria archaeon]
MTNAGTSNSCCNFWDNAECKGTEFCPPRCPRFVDKYGAPIVIRPYQPTDYDRLMGMYEDYASEHRSLGVPPPPAKNLVEEWLDRLTERGQNFVALDGNRIVGHAVYSPVDSEEPELAVFVHQDYHERGIGTELCKHVLAYAADEGYESIVLNVERRNKRAIHVFKKLGFEPTQNAGDEDRFDMIEMRLCLNTPRIEQLQLAPYYRS